MVSVHFLTKTLEKVSTETSLPVLAHKLKRMMEISKNGALMRATTPWLGPQQKLHLAMLRLS
jgi:hypothetical protein